MPLDPLPSSPPPTDTCAGSADLIEHVREAWSAALDGTRFTDDDDFFDVGGHSMLVAGIMARLGRVTGRRLPLRMFFDHPTVKSLTEAVTAATADDGEAAR
ncbi:phosphopantetheine-binding protein [Streptomyces sp. NPDC050610]|uniref:phosphopantetheine-binding protein n=1 Tax=Streptomyces sp. NPDC050610 TaxID=3157097 RepID=UPI0034247D14